MVELEGLQFEIQGSSDEASKSIDNFIKTLERLKRVSASGTSGLDKTADSLKRLNRALTAFDNKKLTRVTNALEKIGNIKGVTLSATLSKRIDDLAASIKHITHDDISKLNDLTEALRDLGSVGDVKIPNIKQKKEKKRVEEYGVSESTEKSVTDLAVVMSKLAKSVSTAIVPLNQLASMGMVVYQAFEEMIEGTFRFIKVAGLLDSGVSKAIVPLNQLASMGVVLYESFEEIIEGTWRYINVAGLLDGATTQAIVPFRELGVVLTETENKFDDVVEGTWRYINATGMLGDGVQRTSNSITVIAQNTSKFKNVFTQIATAISQFGEKVKSIFGNIVSVTSEVIGEFSEWIAQIGVAISEAIAAIAPFIAVIQALWRVISGIIGLFKRFISAIWNLLSPIRELVKEISKKLVELSRTAFKKLGETLISPFTKLKKTVKSLKHGLDNLFASIARIALYRLIRTVIKEISQGFKEGIDNLYQYSKLINGEFAKSMDTLTTNLLYLKNSLGAMASPIINALAPAFDMLTQKIVGVIEVVNQLISRLTGKSTYMAAKKLVKAYQEIKNATIGIDELNIIGDDVDDYTNMFEELPITDDIKSFADKLKEAIEKGDWEGLGRLLGDKVNEAIEKIPWEQIGEKIGYFLNGAIQTAFYFLDTVDFANLGSHLADMMNKILDNIDFEVFGRLFVKKMTVIWDLIIGFFTELDWGLVAKSITNFVLGAFNEFIDWFNKWDWSELARIFMVKIQEFFGNLNMTEIGQKAGEFLKTVFKSFRTWLENVDWEQVGRDLINAIVDFFEGFDFEGVVREFFGFLGAALGAIKDLLKPVWDGIVEWWNNNIKADSFKKTLENLVQYLLKFVDENVLTPFMQAFFGKDMKEGQSGLDKIKEIGQNIIAGILEGAQNYIKEHLFKWIADILFGDWWDCLCQVFGIHSPAESMFPIGENIILGILEGMVMTFDQLLEGVTNFFVVIMETMTKQTELILTSIGEFFITIFDTTSEKLSEIITAVGEFFVTGITTISEQLTNITKAVGEFFTTTLTIVTEQLTNILEATGEGLTNLVTTVTEETANVVHVFSDGLARMVDASTEATANIVRAIGDGISGAIETVNMTIQTWVLGKVLGKTAADVIVSVQDMKEAIADFIKQLDDIPNKIDIKFEIWSADAIGDLNNLKQVLDEIPRTIDINIDVSVDMGDLSGLSDLGIGGHATGAILTVPTFFHALGGIVNKPTMFWAAGGTHVMGEAGSEAILPLDQHTEWMTDVAERVREVMGDTDEYTFEQALSAFYQSCLEPVMTQMSADMRRQADKDEKPVVKIGNKDIRDAYNTQTRADGYSFIRSR